MFLAKNEEAACARVQDCIPHIPSHTLTSWAKQFYNTKWLRARKIVQQELSNREEYLRSLVKAPQLAKNTQWIEPNDVARLSPGAMRAILAKNPQVNPIVVSIRACEFGAAPVAIEAARAASKSKINLNARALLRAAYRCGNGVPESILERVSNTMLENVIEEASYPSEMKMQLRSLLQERRCELAVAESSLAIRPWVTTRDAVGLSTHSMEKLLKSNPDLHRAKAVSMLCAEKCDRSDHISAVARISAGTPALSEGAFKEAMCWGDPGTRLIELFKGPHQEKTFEALFDCIPWLNAKDRPSLILDAAARPNWHVLFRIMLPRGFNLVPCRQYPLYVARNRRVATVPKEARVPYDTEALVWLAKFATRDHVERAIRSGHRIWRKDSIDDHGGLLDLMRAAAWPMKWSPKTHSLLPKESRSRIVAFIICTRRLLYVPHSIIQEIANHLVPNDGI